MTVISLIACIRGGVGGEAGGREVCGRVGEQSEVGYTFNRTVWSIYESKKCQS